MMQTAQIGQMTKDVKDIDFSSLTHVDILGETLFKRRRSVIIVTLENRVATEVDVQKLMEAGMNVARFRMPHQSSKDKIKLLHKIKRATDACCAKYGMTNWPLATCIDLKTRSVKTGILEAEDVSFITLEKDTEVHLTCDVSFFNKCNAKKIYINNPELSTEVKIGMEISIDSDEIELVCTEIVDAKTIKTVVTRSGKLRDICGVCFRCLKSSRPFFTKSDAAIIKFVMDYQVDAVVINYVDIADDIKMIKKCIGKKTRRPLIFSGISTEGGMDNIDEILQESDGIIISRESLTYSVRASYKNRLNNIQKWIAAKCHQAGKPVYLSGGVMQSAIRKGVTDNSELSDVSNALLDGISGFILRDCENIDNTLETVKLLDGICRVVEPYTCTKSSFWRLTEQYMMPVNAAEASVMSCVALANQAKAQVIILPTVTGRTAKALLQMRPSYLILAVCTNVKVTRMLQMFKCMVPLLYSGEPSKFFHLTLTARVDYAVEYAVKMDWLHYGDTYAVLKRATDGSSYCDMVSVLTVTISNKPMVECQVDDESEAENAHTSLLINQT